MSSATTPYGPGDEQTWGGRTDHPHDPRNDPDEEWMGDEPGEPDGPELDEEMTGDDDDA